MKWKEEAREANSVANFLMELEAGLPSLPEVTAESIQARLAGKRE